MKSLIVYIIEKSILLFKHLQSSNSFFGGIVRFLFSRCPRQYVFGKVYSKTFEKQNLEPIFGYENVGVVFQGPYVTDDRFTLNSILLIRKVYPNIHVVLSTWINSIPIDDRERLADLNCHVIENSSLPSEDMGHYRKVGHLNSQLFSSLEGLQYLKTMNVTYALKIRTDLRIHLREFIPYFVNLLNLYKCDTNRLEKRLLTVCFSNNLVYCPFHMSDFIWFGHIKDMLKLYSIPNRVINSNLKKLIDDRSYIRNQALWFNKLLNKSYERNIFQGQNTAALDYDFYYYYHEEAYIVHKFYESLNLTRKRSEIDNYWDFVRKCIIIVDESILDVYWTKYGYTLNQRGKLDSHGILNSAVWSDILLNDIQG